MRGARRGIEKWTGRINGDGEAEKKLLMCRVERRIGELVALPVGRGKELLNGVRKSGAEVDLAFLTPSTLHWMLVCMRDDADQNFDGKVDVTG